MAEGIIHDTESKMEEFKDQLPADEVRLQLQFFYDDCVKKESSQNILGRHHFDLIYCRYREVREEGAVL